MRPRSRKSSLSRSPESLEAPCRTSGHRTFGDGVISMTALNLNSGHPPLVLTQNLQESVESLSFLEPNGRYRESPSQPLGIIHAWLRDRGIEFGGIDDAEGSYI